MFNQAKSVVQFYFDDSVSSTIFCEKKIYNYSKTKKKKNLYPVYKNAWTFQIYFSLWRNVIFFILIFFHHISFKISFWFYYEAGKTILTFLLSISRGYLFLLQNIFNCYKGQHHEKGLSAICSHLNTDLNILRVTTVLVAMFSFSSRNWFTFQLNTSTFSCNYFKTFC